MGVLVDFPPLRPDPCSSIASGPKAPKPSRKSPKPIAAVLTSASESLSNESGIKAPDNVCQVEKFRLTLINTGVYFRWFEALM